MQSIFSIVGIGLLVLAGLSGIALFMRAVLADGDEAKGEGNRRSTLWGLFLVGLIGGLILVKIAHG